MLYGAGIFNDLCLVQFNQYKLTSVVFLEVDSFYHILTGRSGILLVLR